MKKILLTVFLLGNALALNAWVFLDSADPAGAGWLLPKMLSGKQVRVCVDVMQRVDGKSELYHGDQQAAYYAMSAQIVYNAYQNWFDNLRDQIRHSGRKKEFKDLLAVLPKHAPIQFINISPSAKVYKSCRDYADGEVDLRVRATLYPTQTDQPEKGFVTFRLMPDNTGLMGKAAADAPASSLTAALRQTGYTLGLASAAAVKDGLGSPVFAVKDEQPSVMDKAPALTCDDAEGLANLADFFMAKPNSPRAQGWLGFCPQRDVAYAGGVPVKITPQEKQALQAYAAQEAQGPAPLAGKVSAAREKAAQYLRVKQARQGKLQQQLQHRAAEAFKKTKEAQR